ncbi:MAG: phosphatase PAP2 family protein [Rhodocyclales bacterium]|nr:phosphatase PAP2 family protein [Rhodocyclales bacterium]
MNLPRPSSESAESAAVPPPPWYRRCAQRVSLAWLFKAVGTTTFVTLFFWVYLHVLHNPSYAVTTMPTTAFDEWIGFRPQAFWLYASLWFYTSLPPALVESRRELIGYGVAIFAVCALGVACFVAYPTAVPMFEIDWALHPSFAILKRVDTAGNAFPSLHVATAVFSALWLDRQLRETGAGLVVRALSVLWCLGIVYSTMATKQHVAFDVAGGLLLGLGLGWLSLRWVPAWVARPR